MKKYSTLITIVLLITVVSNSFAATQIPWGISAIKAPEAWALAGRGVGVKVLILDSGVDINHPALKASIEQTYDFLSIERKIIPSVVDSKAGGHGTFVAGIIAGSDPINGFTGVAPEAKILVGRVCADEIGECDSHAIVYGIEWGIQEKVDVISMSMGDTSTTLDEEEAVQRALAAGITVVAASGNSGVATVEFPGAQRGVIAVGAIDSKKQIWDMSNWGDELSVVAPGANILSSAPQNQSSVLYGANNGTSFSVPFVSGLVALMKSANKNLSPKEVKSIIESTAEPLGQGGEVLTETEAGLTVSNKYGSGLINAEAAVQRAIEHKTDEHTGN